MAMINEKSCPCVSTQLELFRLPGTVTSQEKNSYVAHYPIASLDDGPIEFDVKPSPMYTDLGDTRLYLRCKVTKRDGTNLPATDDVNVTNMLFHAMFSRLDVTVGDTLITQSSAYYPWKAVFETMLNFGEEAKKSQLAQIMYFKDGNFNDNGNSERQKLVKQSKPFEMFGALHVDLFFQEKYLLNNVGMRIKLTRNVPDFYQVGNTAVKVEIDEAILYVRRVQVSPSVEIAHAKTLMGGKNAVYAINRVEMNSMSIPAGQQTISRDNLFMSKVPKKLIMAMVDNDSFNGKNKSHPFRFQHFNLEMLELQIDGENVCGTPMPLDFSNQRYMRAYDSLFHVTNRSYNDSGLDITYEDYAKGYALFCFDLTPCGCGNSSNHLELSRQGNLRFRMQFSQPLAKTINVILYGEFESTMEITNSREVLLDYRN